VAEAFAPDPAGPHRHPIASFTPLGVRDTFDLAGGALLSLAGAAPALGDAALEWAAGRFLARGELPPAFSPVVDEAHPDWPSLRRYHLFAFRNRPHEYHNGGVWPVWLGWLALALARRGARPTWRGSGRCSPRGWRPRRRSRSRSTCTA
jgi:hypothetical protein